MSTKDVFDHHVKCFGEGDLQGILADYSKADLSEIEPANELDNARPLSALV